MNFHHMTARTRAPPPGRGRNGACVPLSPGESHRAGEAPASRSAYRRQMESLESVASALVRPQRGILAADESIATMSARLAAAGGAPAIGSRRAYREMLVTT